MNRKHNLYYRSKYIYEQGNQTFSNICSALNGKQGSACIDPTSVLSIINKSYIIGDRTLVKGIQKTSWMHDDERSGGNQYAKFELPSHGYRILDAENVARKFKSLLLDEAKDYLIDKNVVGILLSGGMDSRIVAGVVRELQTRGEFNGTVVALTWGLENTRDVVYAKKVVETFNWEHKHYPLSAEILAENIELAATMGAEVSPVHFHAMAMIGQEKGIDCILAGSYGDSVGRGEFSGKKLRQLKDQLVNNYNKFGFLPSSVEQLHRKIIENELVKYQKDFPRKEKWQMYEVEQQCHYMRRQLGFCMDIIDDNIPLYQMFTSPSVFGFIWSLSPECRTDFVYKELLKILPGNLLSIPWARDGKLYPSEGVALDTIPSAHNQYGKWLRRDCYDMVDSALNNGALDSLKIFNPKGLDIWKKNWHKSNAIKADKIDERISWLASLSIFCHENNISSSESLLDSDLCLYIESFKGYFYGSMYRKARQILR